MSELAHILKTEPSFGETWPTFASCEQAQPDLPVCGGEPRTTTVKPHLTQTVVRERICSIISAFVIRI
jgi:hypothetical protein